MLHVGILSKNNSSMTTNETEGDSSNSSQNRRYSSPPPASTMPNGHSYSPPLPASRCFAKMPDEIEPAPDFVWHEINTGHSILNPKILKAPIVGNWGMSKLKYERFKEDEEDDFISRVCSQPNRELSLSLSCLHLAPPGSPDDVTEEVDDDMPPLPTSIKLSMRTETEPPRSPLLSMRFYGHCFIPIRHDFHDVVDDVDNNGMKER